jgi:hypothetical protein
MAEITFHANGVSAVSTTLPDLISHNDGSGLGFFGGGFGLSVPVDQYQDSTFVTNANGTIESVNVSNTKYLSLSGIGRNSDVDIGTSGCPNYYAPLNIRFSHSSGVRVQNCKLRIFDRDDINQHASGVTTQVLELRHPHPVVGHNEGSGSLTFRGSDNFSWREFDPADGGADGTLTTDKEVTFTSCPGVSGTNTSAADPLPQIAVDGYYNWVSNSGASLKAPVHDWYVALSASPDSIGSKTNYGLYFTLEYL